jgi:hypothetical protein
MFVNVSLIYAIECKYSPIASVDEHGNYGGPLPDYSLPEDKKWLIDQGYSITLNSYNSGNGKNVGGDETLQNWDNKNHCPNIIRTTYNFWECFLCDGDEWYGYDDLESAKKHGIAYDKFFIYDKYLNELKQNADEYDHTVSYTCEYKGNHHFTIDFNKDGYALKAKSTMDTFGAYFEYDLSERMMTTKPKTVGECENVHICLSNSISSQYANVNYYTIFTDEIDYEDNKSECKDSVFMGIIHDNTDEFNSGCRTYSGYIETLRAYWNNSSMRGEYKILKNKISNLCNSITKYSDYKESDCLKSCLNIKTDIADIEKITFNEGECGFSERLILWIANIIRWVKYIVPVAVIVLGILDFIKAISADKEDEMKKAQQRFIRRLIAASLIFIAPFIIEFILNKLGFDANGCGIINL